jgi:hypothetical protein
MAQHYPAEKRSAVIAGFLVQEKILSLFGKSLYPLLNWMLESGIGLDDELLRFRLIMGVCTFFCLFGVSYLHRRRHDIPSAPPSEAVELLTVKVLPAAPDVRATSSTGISGAPHAQFPLLPFCLIMVALFAQASAFTTVPSLSHGITD